MKTRLGRVAALGAVLAIPAGLLVSPPAAQARAGGGGHGGSASSGGHGSSSGHYGGSGFSGGSGGLIALLVILFVLWLIFRRSGGRAMPSGGNIGSSAPATAAVSAALGAALGRASGPYSNAVAAGLPLRSALPAALATLRAQDPGFEIETFLQRAEMTFFLVKRGMQRNDSAAIRPYVDDRVFAVVSQYIGQMQAQHRHTLLESLNVRDVHLIDAACGEQGQSLTIHFDLIYRAKTVDDANRVLADEGEDGRHGERWQFVRSAAARTPADGGVIASRCPACGAELRLSLEGICTHCRASVTNGSVDWVVADVQTAPFLGGSDNALAGIAAPTIAEGIAGLRANDAKFDTDAFLARVRSGFVKLQEAWCRQDLEAGRAFLSPGCYFAWRAQLETLAAEGRRNVMENLDVRQVVPLRVIHGRVFDDLTVCISAVSSDYEVDGTGRIVFGDKAVRPFNEEWTFQRSIGVSSSAKDGTLENTCPNCGAPLSLTQIGECRYCKAAVTSGRFDWVVSRIEQEDGNGARRDDADDDLGSQIVTAVGGAVIGGLLGSLFSQDRR